MRAPRACYQAWRNMLRRCSDPTHLTFKNYGGRGITVCERWALSFDNFRADMGPLSAGDTLERIDPNGHYEPANCRWASIKEQANNRRNNVRISIHGKTKTLAQWCELMGADQRVVRNRLERGWDVRSAFCEPVKPKSMPTA